MEAECSRCHRKFQSSTEEMTVCPSCLRKEFSAAPAVDKGTKADSIKQGNQLSYRRAAARAERLSEDMQTGSAFGPHGVLRFVLGVVIFLIGAVMLMVDAELESALRGGFLPESAKLPLSVLLSSAAALLVFTSSRQYKWLIYFLVLVFVAAGCFMPSFWEGVVARNKKETAIAIASSKVGLGETETPEEPKVVRAPCELTEEDLAIYWGKRQSEGQAVNFAIYVNERDVAMRQSIRDALVRLLEAGGCVPYTRAKGSLYIVSRSVGGTRNITRTLERFGNVTYANIEDGVYEVSFSPEKVNAVSPYTADDLSLPHSESFVAANIAELRNLVDPRRVRTAADTLAAANVQTGRVDIRKALIEVLRDPWGSKPEAYQSLAEALAVYATPGDKETVDICRKYFLHSRTIRRIPSHKVTELLIREVPGEMISPMVDLWCADPVEWRDMLAQLGTRPEEQLLEVLDKTHDAQLIVSILKHLEEQGTPEAIPAVKRFVDHPDARVGRTARTTLEVLEAN